MTTHPAPRTRVPFLTCGILALAFGQQHWGWSWALDGSASGLDRLVHSFSAVLAHSDPDHLLVNIFGLIFVTAPVEALLGRRWLAAGLVLAVADMWLFSEQFVRIQGASGLVMACTGILVAVCAAAWRAGRDGHDDLRSRMLYSAATMALLYAPLAAWSDITGLADRDNIAQAAHLRCLAAGLVLGLTGLVLDLRRSRCTAPLGISASGAPVEGATDTGTTLGA